MRQLTDTELNTISNYTATAAEKFEANATELRADVRKLTDEASKREYERLAQVFDRQAKEAREISEMFASMMPVVIATCEKCKEGDPEHGPSGCPDRRLLALLDR